MRATVTCLDYLNRVTHPGNVRIVYYYFISRHQGEFIVKRRTFKYGGRIGLARLKQLIFLWISRVVARFTIYRASPSVDRILYL